MYFETRGRDFRGVPVAVGVRIISVYVLWEGVRRRELSVFSIFVHEDDASISE